MEMNVYAIINTEPETNAHEIAKKREKNEFGKPSEYMPTCQQLFGIA